MFVANQKDGGLGVGDFSVRKFSSDNSVEESPAVSSPITARGRRPY